MVEQSDSFSLWRRCVALWRLVLISGFTLLIVISLSSGRAFLRPWPSRRRAWRVAHFSLWARGVVALIGGRVVWHGTPPEAPFFLASNHLGYLDIVVLAQRLPAVFVSKADVKHWPVIGMLTRLADTLYINRERHRDIPRANATILEALERGDGVVLFPEGTSSESDFVLPIRPSLLEMPARHTYPVNTAAIYFETHAGDPHAHRAICYYGDMAFAPHVWKLMHLRGFTATVRFSSTEQLATDRKELALKVREDIHALQLKNFPDAATVESGAVPKSANDSLNIHEQHQDHDHDRAAR